jgi:hypothetical protein
MAAKLGINAAILTKFLKFRGKVPIHMARSVADRLRSYVRSLDQVRPRREPPPSDDRTTRRKPPPQRAKILGETPLTFSAEQWLMVHLTSETKVKIATISSLLDTIISQIKRTNAPPDFQAITDIERKQLVAVLEAALAILKSPLVEKGLLKRACEGLARMSTRAAEREVEQGIGHASSAARQLLVDLVKSWFS